MQCVILAQGGMFKVEHVETSIDQKLNQTWNCSSIKVTYRVSIFSIKGNSIVQLKSNSIVQLKTKVDTQSGGTKVICKSIINCKYHCKTFDIAKMAITRLI